MESLEKETVLAVGEEIKKLRKNSGLTQGRLAELLGISRTYLNLIENGVRNPSEELLRKIDSFLGSCDADVNPEEAESPEGSIRERREYDGLTQGQLAELLGMDRSYLNLIENGARKPSEELAQKIDYFLDLYDPAAKLEILFDYVRIRFPTTDAAAIVEEVLGIKLKYMRREGRAFFGYASQYVFGNIRLMFSDDENMGCLLELQGKGCREFEVILEAQRRSWYDFLRLVEERGGVLKRIDLAINDRAGWLDIPALAEKCRREECQTLFRAFRNYQSGELIRMREEDRDLMGNTLYLGSTKSEIYFCIYEKDYEQYVKTGTPVEDADIKNRFEIRLKDDRAKHAVDDLLEHEDAGATAFGIINRYVCFLKPGEGEDKRSWELDPVWERFIGEERRRLKLTSEPEPYTLERTKNWIRHQVAPSFKMLRLLSEIRGEDDELERIIEEAKLSPQHKKILKQQQALIRDILAGDYVDFDVETGELFLA